MAIRWSRTSPQIALTPALLVTVAIAIYYLRLDLRFGMAMSVLLALTLWLARALAGECGANFIAVDGSHFSSMFYGAGIASNYQGQGLKLAKQFRT